MAIHHCVIPALYVIPAKAGIYHLSVMLNIVILNLIQDRSRIEFGMTREAFRMTIYAGMTGAGMTDQMDCFGSSTPRPGIPRILDYPVGTMTAFVIPSLSSVIARYSVAIHHCVIPALYVIPAKAGIYMEMDPCLRRNDKVSS